MMGKLTGQRLDQLEEGADVQRESPIKMTGREFGKTAMHAGCGAMNQRGERLFANGLTDLFQALRRGEIGAAEFDRQPFLVGSGLQSIGGFLIADIVRDNRSAGSGKAQGDGAADAARAAGDQGSSRKGVGAIVHRFVLKMRLMILQSGTATESGMDNAVSSRCSPQINSFLTNA